jgi:hypothetical protein
MKNAYSYIGELQLNSFSPSARLGSYVLHLEDASSISTVRFILSKFGRSVGTGIV